MYRTATLGMLGLLWAHPVLAKRLGTLKPGVLYRAELGKSLHEGGPPKMELELGSCRLLAVGYTNGFGEGAVQLFDPSRKGSIPVSERIILDGSRSIVIGRDVSAQRNLATANRKDPFDQAGPSYDSVASEHLLTISDGGDALVLEDLSGNHRKSSSTRVVIEDGQSLTPIAVRPNVSARPHRLKQPLWGGGEITVDGFGGSLGPIFSRLAAGIALKKACLLPDGCGLPSDAAEVGRMKAALGRADEALLHESKQFGAHLQAAVTLTTISRSGKRLVATAGHNLREIVFELDAAAITVVLDELLGSQPVVTSFAR